MKKIAWTLVASALLAGIGLLWLALPRHPARAAVYWQQGVRSSTISLCFVGDAVTSRPQRVQQILDYLEEFENAANIKFNYWGSCPPPTTQNNGDDFYNGDIRVVLPFTSVSGTGPVPGQGCPMFEQLEPGGYNGDNDGWGSWSNAPDDLATNRPCLYNLKLGDDPWCPGGGPWPCTDPSVVPYRNHTLHEFGHALGLAHEHQRLDATCYNPSDDARSIAGGYLTPYDVNSVMHYKFSTASGHTCDTPGNYGTAGLTDWDKLALHILYPEDNHVAEFVGTTVLRTGETLRLQSAWKARGANMAFVADNFLWKLDGVTKSTTPDLVTVMNQPGDYTLTFTHDDFLGRHYSYTGLVRVLNDDDFTKQIVAPVASRLPLLYPTFQLYIYGGIISPAEGVTIGVAKDVLSDTALVDYSPQPASDTEAFKDVGLFFKLEATYESNGQPVQLQQDQAYSITVTYKQADVPGDVDEAKLALYSWDGDQWLKEDTSVVDVNANTVSATPNHFSLWAVLDQARVYLPLVHK